MYKFNILVLVSKDKKYFVTKLPEFVKQRGTSLVYRFANYKNINDEVVYKKLKEAVDNNEKFDFQISAHQFTKDEANEKVFNIQQALIEKNGEDCLLNDIVISPEKYKCKCGKNIRVQFKEAHEKYCEPSIIIIEDL